MRILADQMLASATLDANKVIEEMKAAPAPETIHKLKVIRSVNAAQPTLTLPVSQTELVADAINYVFPERGATYTWRKVYGPGEVAFVPNASRNSNTSVSFIDKKPGKYRFEITMTDVLGYNEVSDTVDVVLYDERGNLPRNKPPQAASQSLEAFSGRPLPFTLTGMDPDGDDLGYVVTQQPAHGRLTGLGANLTYTPKFSFTGTDQLTFAAIDGQGLTAMGTVQFTIAAKSGWISVMLPHFRPCVQVFLQSPASR